MSNKERMLTATKIMATHYKDKSWIELPKKKDLKTLDKAFLIVDELLYSSSIIKNREDSVDAFMYGLLYLTPEVETRIRGLKNRIDHLVNTCGNFKEDKNE